MKTFTTDPIELKLKEIIANELDINVSVDEINSEISLYEDGVGLDSISIVNLIVQIEDKFNIELLENEISTSVFSNIKSLAKFIREKIDK